VPTSLLFFFMLTVWFLGCILFSRADLSFM
jgi:hypothetical protein